MMKKVILGAIILIALLARIITNDIESKKADLQLANNAIASHEGQYVVKITFDGTWAGYKAAVGFVDDDKYAAYMDGTITGHAIEVVNPIDDSKTTLVPIGRINNIFRLDAKSLSDYLEYLD